MVVVVVVLNLQIRGGNFLLFSLFCFLFLGAKFDKGLIDDGPEAQKILFFDYLPKRFVRRYLGIKK